MVNTSGHYPVRDLVLVLPDEEVETKQGLIVIPESVKERSAQAQTYGFVVAHGESAFLFELKEYGVKTDIHVGSRVMFAKYGGIMVKGEDGKSYRLLRDGDLTCTVSDKVKKEIE
jgi:co-chaperonin GroES (HSP10)